LDAIETIDGPNCGVIAFDGLRLGGVLCDVEDWKAAFVTPPGRLDSVAADDDVAENLVGFVPVAVPEYIPPSTYRALYANIRPGLVVEFPNTTELLW
jgi:hypothetical protein